MSDMERKMEASSEGYLARVVQETSIKKRLDEGKALETSEVTFLASSMGDRVKSP